MIKYFPEKVQTWNAQVNSVMTLSDHGLIETLYLTYFQVDKHRDSLLNYIIFLRITPFLPNWFINMTSPVIGVPVFPFVFGTFLG